MNKDGQICFCINFLDLNKACPEDELPLHIPKVMKEIVFPYVFFSFMDGFFGYNKIKMVADDEKLTSFRTPLRVYFYMVRPLFLKNFGAT